MITAEGILATACLDSCVILDENLHIQQGPKKRYASNRNEKKKYCNIRNANYSARLKTRSSLPPVQDVKKSETMLTKIGTLALSHLVKEAVRGG